VFFATAEQEQDRGERGAQEGVSFLELAKAFSQEVLQPLGAPLDTALQWLITTIRITGKLSVELQAAPPAIASALSRLAQRGVLTGLAQGEVRLALDWFLEYLLAQHFLEKELAPAAHKDDAHLSPRPRQRPCPLQHYLDFAFVIPQHTGDAPAVFRRERPAKGRGRELGNADAGRAARESRIY
jgi:hypothetical protein